jgi:drug/metabolite transporter (DMT)-like permease
MWSQTLLFAAVVFGGTLGELAIARASKQVGEVHDFSPRGLARFAWHFAHERWLWIGLSLMALAFFCLLGLLSHMNVSVVVPITALTYVAGAMGGKFFLHEQVTPRRWAGLIIVCVGVAMVCFSQS